MGDSDDRAYLDEFPRPGLIEGASDGRGMGWSLKMFGVRTWMSILKIEKHRCANDMRKKITEMEKAHENVQYI